VREPIPDDKIERVIFTPNDAVKAALEAIEERRSYTGVGVRTGISTLDELLLPGRPGDFIGVIGKTSHYKSGLMQFIARAEAKLIQREHIEDEAIVYVTWEQSIDEMVAFDLAYTARMNAADVLLGKVSDEEMERLRMVHGPRRAVLPVYLIGHSTRELRERPSITLAVVQRGLEQLRENYGLKPRAVFLDYLQQIIPEEGRDKLEQVFNGVSRIKDMALALGCPVFVGSQAKMEAYDRKWGVPQIMDSQWGSNFGHTCDKALGVWFPIKDLQDGDEIVTKKLTLNVTPNLLIVQILKQKLRPSGQWLPLFVRPEVNDIQPMDTRKEYL
jgi:replicative DNA helicase